MIGVAGQAFPDRISAARSPGGVVIVIYRWRDKAVLAERHLTSLDDIEAFAELDSDTFTDAWVDEARTCRAVVLVGYDGDDGRAMIPPRLFTDNPSAIQ